MDIFRGLLMMAYPGYHGLGTFEPIRLLLEDRASWTTNGDMMEYLDVENATLWSCNKELTPNKKFSDFFGKNEKMKMVVKI